MYSESTTFYLGTNKYLLRTKNEQLILWLGIQFYVPLVRSVCTFIALSCLFFWDCAWLLHAFSVLQPPAVRRTELPTAVRTSDHTVPIFWQRVKTHLFKLHHAPHTWPFRYPLSLFIINWPSVPPSDIALLYDTDAHVLQFCESLWIRAAAEGR